MPILLELLISVVALIVLLVGGWAFDQVATAPIPRSSGCDEARGDDRR